MPLWSCTNLRFGYHKQIVLSCPNFAISAGSCIRIAGPNGAGKTTLLRVISGLLAPLSGSITNGSELTRGSIGYLPQRSPLQDDFPATVWEVVLSGCQTLRGMRPYFCAHEIALAKASLQRFSIENLKDQSYRELSGGQRQRVLLARSMAVPRKLLLLDEPTTGLDIDSVRQLKTILSEVQSVGTAIVVITHDSTLLGNGNVETIEIQREEIRYA